MIYITGDTHGNYDDFIHRIQKIGAVTEKDIVIICGDFGFVGKPASLEKLSEEKYTIAFCDGNHENFDLLYQYPAEVWNGGKIHRISDNIIHLMRGQVFGIGGMTFFSFGGAYSPDKSRRTEHINWWKQELPCAEEYREAAKNLEMCAYEVDYVITHTVPLSVIYRMGIQPDRHDIELIGYLDWLRDNLKFKRWFAGHFHLDETYDNIDLLFSDVTALE